MAGRPKREEDVEVVFLRLPKDVLGRVVRCTGMIEITQGVKLNKTEAFRRILEAGCAAIEGTREGSETPVSAQMKLSEIAEISSIPIAKIAEIAGDDVSVPGYGFPEDEDEIPALQPAPANHVNGQGAPAPQPTTQPAIPLALEPAPKTAHPVDVPQVSAAPTESQNGEADIPPYDTDKYVLGKLCPRGHDYHGTGQSLRHLRRHVCLECDAEGARERRKAKRQGQPA
jgi:hypothetical protein